MHFSLLKFILGLKTKPLKEEYLHRNYNKMILSRKSTVDRISSLNMDL